MTDLLGLSIGTIISGVFYSLFALAAVVVGIVLYTTVFCKKNDGKYTGFMGRLYDFVNVKKFSLEPLLKAAYIIAALYITLSALLSFSDYNAWRGLGKLAIKVVLDNALLRIGYELALLLVRVLKKLDSIGDKLGADGEKSEFAEEIFPKGVKAAVVQQNAPVQQNVAVAQPAPVPQPVPAPVPQPVQSAPVQQPIPQPVPVPAPVPQPVEQSAPAAQPAADVQPAAVAQPAAAAQPAADVQPAAAQDFTFCTVCGKQIKANSKFCPYCGNSR